MRSLTRRQTLVLLGLFFALAVPDRGGASDATVQLQYVVPAEAGRFQDVPLQAGLPGSFDRDRLLAIFDRAPDFLGWFTFGPRDPSPITVARFDRADRSDFYLDLNRDQVLSENERASPIDASEAGARGRQASPWTADVPLSSQQAQDSPVHTLRFRVARSTGGMFVAQTGRLRGHADMVSRPVAAQLFDTDCNGSFSDSADRLHLDLNGDGRFSPLREKFACRSVIRIGNERLTLGFAEDERQLTLEPLSGTGYIAPTITLEQSDAEVSEFHALIVSDDGVHVSLDRLDQPSELPVGNYRVEQLQLKLRDDRRWAMNFSRSSTGEAEKARISKGMTSPFDLLGTLTLESTINGGDVSAGALTIQPSLTTATGLYLTSSRVGKSKAQDDNQLTASLMRLDADGDRKPVSVSGTGFQCGTFCPVVFADEDRIAQSSLVFLEFDSGPLAGPMIRVTVPPRLQSTLSNAPATEIP